MQSLRWKLFVAGAACVALAALACALLLDAARGVLRVPEERLHSAQQLEALLTVSTEARGYLGRAGEALVSDVPDLEAVREARAAVAAELARLERGPGAHPGRAGAYRPLRDAFAALDGRVRGALMPGQMRHRAGLDAELALVEATYAQEWEPALAEAVQAAREDAARVQGDAAERTDRLALLLAALPAALALALLLLFLAVLRAPLRGLQALHAGAQRLARGERGVRVPVRSADEVGMLCSTFNRLAWELEQGEDAAAEREPAAAAGPGSGGARR